MEGVKFCPLMLIADNIGHGGRQGVPFGNRAGYCIESDCGIWDKYNCQCGLISKEVPVYAKSAEEG